MNNVEQYILLRNKVEISPQNVAVPTLMLSCSLLILFTVVIIYIDIMC